MRKQSLILFLVACCFGMSQTNICSAALPPEVRKELTELGKELKEAPQLIKKKQVDEAKAVIQKVEDRVKELDIPEDEKDRSFTSLRTQLEKAKAAIPVSFEREVAPILNTKCVGCHGENQASGNLRMHTYNAMAQGGRSGPLARAHQPQQSLVLARLVAPMADQRMPRGGERLPDTEIQTIARWIEQGATFDGEDRNAPIGDSTVIKKPPVTVVKADGTETVSFKNDIAPWMVNVCIGCHSGDNARGGFALTSFETLLQGGDTGQTIVPGDPDKSYIVDLVLRQKPMKMPAGQAQLKRSQAVALETWIREGARFDGTDPKAPLRTLVPTPAEMEANRLASMTDADFEKRREQQAIDTWKRVSPREEARLVSSGNLFVYGSATEERLKSISDWGELHVTALTEKYKLPAGEKAWRGKLIVFVAKDRFDYEEFNNVLLDRRTPKSISGHIDLTKGLETAYIVMHDIGDEPDEDGISSQQLLNSLLSQAYLARDGAKLPLWLLEGFGLTEAGIPGNSVFIKGIPGRAATAVATVTDAARIFDEGTFAPDEVGPVGYLLVRYMIGNGGPAKFQQFVQELRSNPSAAAAIQKVYNTSAANLGQGFIRSGGK